MTFELNEAQQFSRACADLRLGLPVLLGAFLQDVGKLQGDTHLILAAEGLSEEQLKMLRALNAPVRMALTAQRAHVLNLPVYDGDYVQIDVPDDKPAAWVRALANPSQDLDTPMKGPLQVIRDTQSEKAAAQGGSHASRAGILLAKNAQLLPAVLVVRCTPQTLQSLGHLNRVDYDTIRQAQELDFVDVSAAQVPLEVSEQSRVHVFRQSFGLEEHYAIEIGVIQRSAPVLTRLHSACFTGDLIGSLKCDCGAQLRAALQQMGDAGGGVLLYLNQEGRGIGLANKMRAYRLQDQGFDTVEANHRLGFEDDERDFRIGAQILKALGVSQVRLLTNNPAKIERMGSHGIDVCERVPLRVGQTLHNENYLAVKKQKSGHLL